MTLNDTLNKLHSGKSADRRGAAKKIGKTKNTELGNALFEAYLHERKDKRTWETQTEMIIALGLIDHQLALEKVIPIVRQNEPDDMITFAAAQTYIRLKRESLSDGQPSLTLLSFGGSSVVHGCLIPLGDDRMLLPEHQIKELIMLSWDMHLPPYKIPGLVDPRHGLVTACAGWEKELTQDFLAHCLETGDHMVKLAAERALNGKY